jgi:excisionase family DNA binding protein
MGDKLLLVSVVATRLNCDTRKVYKMIKHGDLPAIRVGPRGLRVFESDLVTYLNANIVNSEDVDA